MSYGITPTNYGCVEIMSYDGYGNPINCFVWLSGSNTVRNNINCIIPVTNKVLKIEIANASLGANQLIAEAYKRVGTNI